MAAAKHKKVRRERAEPRAHHPMPTLNYEAYIAARVDRLARLSSGGPGEPVESESQRRANIKRSLRARLADWQNVGDVLAGVLEDAETPAAIKSAIWREWDELNEAAGALASTSEPAMVRLLYPLLRDIADERAGT